MVSGLLAATLISAAFVAVSAKPAQASETLCTGYDACNAAGYSTGGFDDVTNNIGYWNMIAGHNCTNYVAYRLVMNGMPNVRPWVGNGNGGLWADGARSVGIRVDGTPAVGSVATWPTSTPGTGGAGHVAYVERINGDGTIRISEDSYHYGIFDWKDIPIDPNVEFIHILDLLEVTASPAIGGTPAVDSTLTADPGSWTHSPSFGYQWNRNGAAISGATDQYYTLAQEDIGAHISVTVTGTAEGFATTRATSGSVTGTGAYFDMFVPSVVGSPHVDSTLTASLGTRTSDVALSYQWKRDGVAISGATDRTYTLTQDDVGAEVWVTITGAKTGYATTSASSTSVSVSAGYFNMFIPSLVGTPDIGSTLIASVATQTPAISLTYQWKRDGVAIEGATGQTYAPAQHDLGAVLSVTITGTKTGYNTTSATAVASGPVTGTPLPFNMFVPSFTGTPRVDSTLSASLGTQTPGVALTYQWNRNGADIAGATNRDYRLTQSDIGTNVSVTITGSKPGYYTTSANSTSVVVAGAIFDMFVPYVSGTPHVDSTLTASLTTQTPDVSLSYQWKRDGVWILGATGRNYTLTQADVGAGITVTITGTKVGYDTTSATSTSVTGTAANFNMFVPNIIGTPKVDSTLTASLTTQTAGVAVTYQWKRNGSSISGATGQQYTLSQADIGTGITVTITGTKAGYHTTSATSTSVTGTAANFNMFVPLIQGTPKVDSTLTASLQTQTAGVSVSYQWKRNGSAISGATGQTYRPTQADIGTQVTVTITGAKAGYDTTSASAASVTVTAAYFNMFVVTFAGTPQVDSTLTASLQTQTAGVSLSYQWKSNGAAISGATGQTYKLKQADIGDSISVTITGAKSGYDTTSATSAAKTVTSSSFGAVTASVSGTAKYGSVLTARYSVMYGSPTMTYQWYRNGVAVSGRTGSTYALSTLDVGKRMSVKVTFTKAGYRTVTASSPQTAVVVR